MLTRRHETDAPPERRLKHLCRTCEWWIQGEDGPRKNRDDIFIGQCRRDPPQVMAAQGGFRGFWPLTLEMNGCGAHSDVSE